MRTFAPPAVETRVARRCPRCGGVAAVHGRIVRAIHDWETTFVECLRLRCCGQTFLAAPRGLTPRARYSDRVVGLVRALAGLGVPLRDCARVLAGARVPATVQAIRRWCADLDVPPTARARATLLPAAAPPAMEDRIDVPLGARVRLALTSGELGTVWARLEAEMPQRSTRAAEDAASRLVVMPRGSSRLPYAQATAL
jgi:hypothetical protein